LPTIYKIIQRHVATQLFDYLKKHNLLYANQSGFREYHSCCTALLKLIDSWLTDIDDGKCICAIVLDLKKAFDLVDHDILLKKMKMYNVSDNTIKFFKSYLSNRTQIVKNGEFESSSRTVLTGVPHG